MQIQCMTLKLVNIYKNVLVLDDKYDFIYNENNPLVEIKYFLNQIL